MKKMSVAGGIVLVLIVIVGRCLGIEESTLEELIKGGESTKEIKGKLANYLPTTNLGDTLGYTYFTVSFSKAHRQAEWVAYELKASDLMKEEFQRPNGFRPDPRIESEYAVDQYDYTRTGYDRGHLCASADMSWSIKAMNETFFTTNVSPQDPLFNRGIWKSLESHVRGWAVQYEHLYVITGPVLTLRAKARFPKEKRYVAVPQMFYKVLLDYSTEEAQGIGFILKNEEGKKHLSKYAVTIDEVEKLTGIDFFPNLPKDVAYNVEGKVKIEHWFSTFSTYSYALDTSEIQ